MQLLKQARKALVGRRLNPQKPQSAPYFGEGLCRRLQAHMCAGMHVGALVSTAAAWLCDQHGMLYYSSGLLLPE
jgi:hypothetical protein